MGNGKACAEKICTILESRGTIRSQRNIVIMITIASETPEVAASGVSSCLESKYDYCNHPSIREVIFLTK